MAMAQLPGLGPLESTGVVADWHLRLMAIAIASLLLVFGTVLWTIQRGRRPRASPRPAGHLPADLGLTIGRNGKPSGVAWCVRHGRRTPACDEHCVDVT